MGCCAGSGNAREVHVPTHGIKFQFEKKPMLGKPADEAKAMVDMLGMVPNRTPEQKILTNESVTQKRVVFKQGMAMQMQKEQALFDDAESKTEMTTFKVKNSTSGDMIEVNAIWPKDMEDKNGPAYIWAHGGAAIYFEAQDFIGIKRVEALKLNATIFNVNYRKAPEAKCPDNQQDFVDVIRYIYTHGPNFAVDPNKLAIGGESGGGWIAAGAVNLMIKAGDIDKVKTVFLETPMLSDEIPKVPEEQREDYEWKWGSDLDEYEQIFKFLAKDYAKQQDDGQLYPTYASAEILKQYPPTFIWTMEFDYLRRASETMAKRLKEQGRLVDISVLPGQLHALMGSSLQSDSYQAYFEEKKNAFNAVFHQ